jgi:hypothetical protein
MTAISRTPDNTNLLQPTKFLLTFDRIPGVVYFCQEANIPGLSLTPINVPSPAIDYHVAANKVNYSMFNVKFMVDEKVESWKNIYDWLMSIASPHGTDVRNTLTEKQNQFKAGSFPNYSDAVLTVLSNLNNPVMRVHLVGLFPTSLSDIQFDTTLSADHIITADASFSVKYFDFLDA